MISERITSPYRTEDDLKEESLRPRTFDDFIGQEKIKSNLRVFVESAKKRGTAVDHILLSGPPGLGKTTLAGIVANEIGAGIKSTSAPALEKTGDLAALLSTLEDREVLFIDEIHRLKPAVEEMLYTAMEDFHIDVPTGFGVGAKPIRVPLKRFTLIGATTRTGLLSAPLRSRFGITLRIDYYPPDELKRIVLRSAEIMGIQITDSAAGEIAKRSRGTPRIANRLLRRIVDFATVESIGEIGSAFVDRVLVNLGVDEEGLDEMDRKILEVIVLHYQGGPVGVKTISASVGEEEDTIEDVYEPYLIQKGFIARTPRGRVATPKAFEHIGVSIRTDYQKSLF